MKIKEGFKIENVAGENFVIATGTLSLSFKDTIILNDTAFFIFKNLSQDTTIEEIASKIVAEYDVDLATAKKDVLKVIDNFKSYNILEGI